MIAPRIKGGHTSTEYSNGARAETGEPEAFEQGVLAGPSENACCRHEHQALQRDWFPKYQTERSCNENLQTVEVGHLDDGRSLISDLQSNMVETAKKSREEGEKHWCWPCGSPPL